MRHFFINILLAVVMLGCGSAAQAQCGIENHAVKAETVKYNLYYNWQFVWMPAGTATLTVSDSQYKGKPAFRTSLVTQTSAKVDKFFCMRDTLLVYSTKDIVPLYYRKGSSEGKRYYTDEVWYSYPNGKCAVTCKHLSHKGVTSVRKYQYDHCVYDMINIFQRVRNYDPTGWKKGKTMYIDITGFSELVKAKVVYHGKTVVKADNGKKYNCLELSYHEVENGKAKEIVRFFVTDDSRHTPVRIDMNLRFGSAKAFLKGCSINYPG